MSIIPTRPMAAVLAPTLLALVLAACGNKDDKKTATQVAAKVGSEEVTVHQINQLISRANTGAATPQMLQALRKEALEKLIDQQLAVNQATDNKLNRAPEVVAQLEASRREVLARAYVQQLASAIPKPDSAEIKKYYTEHPQLFMERRVFNIQEIQIPAASAAAVRDPLRAMVAANKSMEDVAAWLKSKDVKFAGGAATRAAEQIPLELLAKVHALKDGQTDVMESPQGLVVVRVVASQSAPVGEAAAVPRIEQFLTNQRAAQAVEKNIKDLRAKSTITYMGEFTPAAGSVTVPTDASATSKPAATATLTAPAAPETAASGAAPKSVLGKGVAGLK